MAGAVCLVSALHDLLTKQRSDRGYPANHGTFLKQQQVT